MKIRPVRPLDHRIAPTQLVPIIREKSTISRRSFDLVRWGLIPFCAKDPSIATKTVNATPETAADKPACRAAHCVLRLLPDTRRRPLCVAVDRSKTQTAILSFGMADDSVFAFDRLSESWVDPHGKVVESCTILITKPNSLVDPRSLAAACDLEAKRLPVLA